MPGKLSTGLCKKKKERKKNIPLKKKRECEVRIRMVICLWDMKESWGLLIMGNYLLGLETFVQGGKKETQSITSRHNQKEPHAYGCE